MILKDYFLAQLDREAASTRKTIERFPEGHNDFKPHPRSMEFGYLASLVASMLGWIALIIDRDALDLDAPEGDEFRTKTLNTKAELLASLDTAVANARRALESTTDEHLAKPWAFKMGGKPSISKPAQHHDRRRRLQPSRPSSRTAHRLSPPPRSQSSRALRPLRRRALLTIEPR